jgi:aminopeptidase N
MAFVCFGHVNTRAGGRSHRTSRARHPDYGGYVPPLTHDEARHRAALIRVTGYDLSLDLTADEELFASTTTIRFGAVPDASTFVDVAPRELQAARLNGRDLDVASLTDGRLPLAGLAAENELVVEAAMAYSHDGEGLHRHVDPADGVPYLYAMSFLDAAPRWFACFDQPDLKAPFSLRVIAPPEWTVLGNGPARSTCPGQWHIQSAHPIATYFATVVAGPYHSIETDHDGIRLGVHARASLAPALAAEAPEILEVTARCLDEFHRLFGIRHPWGEYHQAFVPDFNAGAMENPGCVTFRDSFVFRSRVTESERGSRATTIAHEMAHQWFGNLVTMRWWDDLWLNESFAEYLGYRVCDAVTDYRPWVEFGAKRKAWGYAADRRPSTHPVAGNGAVDTKRALTDFDGISYAKGASVLRQLAVRLGDDTLLAGLREYFRAHAYGNATFADLFGAWSSAGASDLGPWATAWLRTFGMDTLYVHADGAAPAVQRIGDAERSHAVAIAMFDDQGRELARQSAMVDRAVTVPRAALVLPDAGDYTWAKTSFDPDTWQGMPSMLPRLDDPLARVTVWNALRLAVADAEISPTRALDIVTSALPSEVDALVSTATAWALDTLAGVYVPDGAPRTDAIRRLAAAAAVALRQAEPGSGRQLAAARSLVAASDDVGELQAWLTSDAAPAGLVVDAELRWGIVARLASLGAIDSAGIDAEFDRDHSSQGLVHAAHCRAALPAAEAKASTWQAMMSDRERSNHELYALAGGFWRPEQTTLTAPYVERYFEEIAGTARLRQGWVVGRLAGLVYPRTAVSRLTLERSNALLARDDLDSGIRRAVVDATDDLRRALASRERFTA